MEQLSTLDDHFLPADKAVMDTALMLLANRNDAGCPYLAREGQYAFLCSQQEGSPLDRLVELPTLQVRCRGDYCGCPHYLKP